MHRASRKTRLQRAISYDALRTLCLLGNEVFWLFILFFIYLNALTAHLDSSPRISKDPGVRRSKIQYEELEFQSGTLLMWSEVRGSQWTVNCKLSQPSGSSSSATAYLGGGPDLEQRGCGGSRRPGCWRWGHTEGRVLMRLSRVQRSEIRLARSWGGGVESQRGQRLTTQARYLWVKGLRKEKCNRPDILLRVRTVTPRSVRSSKRRRTNVVSRERGN